MATPIERIVDAHVHLWDPEREGWYPYFSSGEDVGLGDDISGMNRFFDLDTYFLESAKWPVKKLVHVAAAAFLLEETLELEELGRRAAHPDALIGGIVPTDPVADIVKLLDDQMAATRFRGVRAMGFVPGGVPDAEVLRALVERNLVFDVMVMANELESAARGLADHGDLTVVLEHTGWPRSGDDDEYALWKKGMTAFAALEGNVHCKLSGLAMPLHSTDAAVFKPWIEYALEKFGVDRCFFGSNFPVDSTYGSFDDLYSTYDTLTADLDAASRDKLFATNAEAVYRI